MVAAGELVIPGLLMAAGEAAGEAPGEAAGEAPGEAAGAVGPG